MTAEILTFPPKEKAQERLIELAALAFDAPKINRLWTCMQMQEVDNVHS